MIKRIFAIIIGLLIPFALFYIALWYIPWGGWYTLKHTLIWATLFIPSIASFIVLFAPNRSFTAIATWVRWLLGAHALIMLLIACINWVIGIAVTAIILDCLVLCGIPSIPFLRNSSSYFKKALLWSVVLFFGGGMIWSMLNIGIVIWRAEKIANGHPYCIQVASQTDFFRYEAPKSFIDLSGLKMRARESCGPKFCNIETYHAILFVNDAGKKYRNWSYWQQNFVDEVKGIRLDHSPLIYCSPEPHFALHLPFVIEDKTKKFTVSIGGKSYAIPQIYKPRVSNNAKGISTLNLPMHPNFEPYHSVPTDYDIWISQEKPNYLNDLLGRSRDWRDWFVLRNNERLRYWTVQNTVEEFGLKKVVMICAKKFIGDTQSYAAKEFNRNRGKQKNYLIYYKQSRNGQITSFIKCHPDHKIVCSHHFVRDNLLYSFHYKKELLSSWDTMEKKLVDLINSFEVTEKKLKS